MAKNNHFCTNSRRKLDELLRSNQQPTDDGRLAALIDFAHTLAYLENTVAVISDMRRGESRIIAGSFGSVLGIDDYSKENSIWESRILEMMTPEEREAKIIAELRFYHFLRHVPRMKRVHYYLAGRLRLILPNEKKINVLHRMYYVYDDVCDCVLYAICLYSPLSFELKWKSMIVNSLTGDTEELATTTSNKSILGRRQCQVLSLIDQGLNSAEISDRLHISINTVSRHRQDILAKLKVKNSIEACRLAKRMELI